MLYIFVALGTYTAAVLIGTAASRALNPILLSGVVNSVSAVLPIILAYPLLSRSTFTESRYGIVLGIVAGILIAIFTIALNKSYAVNKVAIVSPIVFGGSIVLSSIIGSIIFKEHLARLEMIGLAVVSIGIALIIYAKVTG
jgi:drug/metabolite transporter (DMT)-like permease